MEVRRWRKIMLSILFILAQCIFLQSYVFQVRKISVIGNALVPANDIIAGTSLQVGCNFLSYFLQGLPQKVKSMPQLQSASVKFCPGGVVKVAVKEHPPVASVACRNPLTPWVAVERHGYILGSEPDKSGLPRLVIAGDAPAFGRIHQENIDALLTVREDCEALFGKQLVNYELDSGLVLTVVVNILNRPTAIVVGQAREFAYKSKIISALMLDVTKAGKPVKSIDVRFAKPVVALVDPPKPSPTPTPDGVDATDATDATDVAGSDSATAQAGDDSGSNSTYAAPEAGYGDASSAESSQASAADYSAGASDASADYDGGNGAYGGESGGYDNGVGLGSPAAEAGVPADRPEELIRDELYGDPGLDADSADSY